MAGFFHTISEDFGKLLLRLSTGSVLLFHGIFKLSHGIEWIKYTLAEHHLPGFLAYGAYAGEVIAPILLILGYRTRIAALVIAFDMLLALGLVMRSQILVIKEMGGGWGVEIEAMLLFASLALFFTGGGKFSVTKTEKLWD